MSKIPKALLTALAGLILAACGSPSSLTTTGGATGMPTVSVTADSTFIANNSSTIVHWTSTNSSSCSSSSGTGGSGTSGSFDTGALNSTTSYTITCVGSSGSAAKNIIITVAPSSATSIDAVSNAWAAEPLLSGAVYYYCDCGTGAESGCVAGNDSNSGTDPGTPRRTIGNAATRFGSLAVNDTVALCKGGAFNASASLNIGSTGRCPAGTACNDLREYSPTTFAGTAKPVINWSPGDFLFKFDTTGDVRILNIRLQGSGGNSNYGFFFYEGAHNVTLGNLELDNFVMAIYNESNAGNNKNIKMTGNHITNTHALGYLGASDDSDISYNYWLNNGSSNNLDHTIYLASSSEVRNVSLVGNYVEGQYGSTCLGAPVEGHFAVDGFLVKDNYIKITEAAWAPGCWGMEFNNDTGATDPVYHRNTTISGNTIINGGNTGFNITGCSGCAIENNLIIFTIADGTNHYGMRIPLQARRGAYDDVNTGNVIRNNSVYYASTADYGGRGIVVGVEGTGYIVANNSVVYAGADVKTGVPFSCYSYPLALAAYTFINNNHCYSAASFNWEEATGSLTAWKTAAPAFDTLSFTADPIFKLAGTDFRPDTGSPLIGAGNNTYKPTYDITGALRPDPPSIGAYEP